MSEENKKIDPEQTAAMGNATDDGDSESSGEEYRELAEHIYDLDLKVYETTGSSLGRVFNDDRERCVRRMIRAMEDTPEEHLVRSEVVLIGNMARTIRDKSVRKEIMTAYNEIMQKLLMMQRTSIGTNILDKRRARLNPMSIDGRFAENQHLIICISRTYGSGGNYIGFGLADKLKIDYYDAEIFNATLKRLEAEQDGLTDEADYVGLQLQKSKSKNPGLDVYTEKTGFREWFKKLNRYHGLPKKDALFFNQSDLICEMAQKSDFVVMGRCADVILRNNNIPHISIFITAPFERRVRNMMEYNHQDRKTTEKYVQQVDRAHAAYYEYFTGLKWGQANHYDFCLNSASYGIQGSVDFILRTLKYNGVKFPHHLEPETEAERATLQADADAVEATAQKDAERRAAQEAAEAALPKED
ncbi:AAA family ATPase [[Clostridium] aminophilum]|uniref:Cytidylate kinase-like family protein n=1 Tax=[Clostridium] aminophilum TaxID=1526 RepID=A0A1I6JWZ3_9FIRM|nr:cytidylate kinase-like family protein [[Clostridium] aminophilum]SFR83473.1 Cytidylate kinase-like family protein [[Clostridium] aminophilum]